jgi:Holliday junction resolvase RusA-like endonuclease
MSNVISIKAYKRKKRWRFAQARKSYSPAHPRNEAIARFRLVILNEWHPWLEKREKGKTKAEATFEFLSLVNSNLALKELKLKHVSRASLYGWEKKYREGGLSALAPRYGWKPESTAPDVPKNLTSKLTTIQIPGPPKAIGKDETLFWIRHYWQNPPLQCPIEITVLFSMPVRRKTKMRTRIKMCCRKISHTRTPYLDSLTVFIMGCLFGEVFLDHRQVVSIQVKKWYSSWPQTLIVVRALSG